MGELNAHHQLWLSGEAYCSVTAIEEFIEKKDFILFNNDDTLLWKKIRSIESSWTLKSLKNPAIKV